MRYQVLATDYDGTIAHHGQVSESTTKALESLLATGRRLVLVTGRELPELLDIFPQVELFEWVVAENGGLLYQPSSKSEKALAEPPSPEFLSLLRSKQVERLSVGQVIVATWEPHQKEVLETIQDLGLEKQVIFNKGAVMVLPSGINKATGPGRRRKFPNAERDERKTFPPKSAELEARGYTTAACSRVSFSSIDHGGRRRWLLCCRIPSSRSLSR